MWYYYDGAREIGPKEKAEVIKLVASGIIQRTTMVWREGMPEWEPADSTELKGYLKLVPSPANSPTIANSEYCSERATHHYKSRWLKRVLIIGGEISNKACDYADRVKMGFVPDAGAMGTQKITSRIKNLWRSSAAGKTAIVAACVIICVSMTGRISGFRDRNQYYPIRVGMSWVYSVAGSFLDKTMTGTVHQTVIGEKKVNGKTYFIIEIKSYLGTQETPIKYDFVRLTPEGVVQLDTDNKEFLLLASDLKVGHYWESKGAELTIENTVADVVNLVVSGRKFLDCVKIVSESTSVGQHIGATEASRTSHIYYRAPGVGVIRGLTRAKTNFGELTMSYELTHFNK